MGQCHKCNFPLKDGAIACPQCGDVIVPIEDGHGTVDQVTGEIAKTIEFTSPEFAEPEFAEPSDTDGETHDTNVDEGTASEVVSAGDKTIDFSKEMTLDVTQQTLDFSASDYRNTLKQDFTSPDSESEDVPAGTGTVDAMGPDGASALTNYGLEEDEIVMELDEDMSLDASHATLDATGQPSGSDGQSTHVATTPVEGIGDDQVTYVVSPNSPFAAEHSDDVGTIQLPAAPSENAGERTAVYGSSDTGPGTLEAGSSGTEGRLKRLWDGVAGSSGNPMHSLQATGLQASDSIFERVATRRVADGSVRGGDLEADYQIVNKLGEGAMGIVFSARQTTIDRVVALKMAKPSFQQNEEARRRFLYEAQITADLDHSNIVPIHELGANESGMLFYSMKLVQGTGWNSAIRKKTREQNLEIFMKVTDAIAFAHSKGVIHRDLKPENTMLGRFGEVFVTDWGTAINLEKDTTRLARPAMQGDKFITVEDGSKFRRGDTIALLNDEEVFEQRQIVSIDDIDPNRLYLRKKLTHTYQSLKNLRVMKAMNMAGTPCYMAPEMAGHDLPRISRRSDIYVLGAILYDIVTGRAPHTGKSVTECLRAALDNDVFVKDNDDPLLQIAYKAMQTEPEDRFQSVEELQEAVREYRRHAESIALSDRSDELLELAKTKGDYEMYSRTLFGYRDAIDLWPENQAASTGLLKARLAFGEAAFKKGDFDLVLQTVDQSVAEEAALYARAIEAKKKVAGREKSLKVLKKVIAAVVTVAVVGLSGTTIFAFVQWASATTAAKNEKIERQKAQELAASESAAKETAQKATEAAEKLAASESAAKKTAEKATEEAIKERIAAEMARESESAAKTAAQQAAIQAKEAEGKAVEAAKKEQIAAAIARQRAAQIQLGEYTSSLALAKSQFESFDIAQGQESLLKLNKLPMDVFNEAAQPDFNTWGWRRIQLLSNGDLPKERIDGSVTAVGSSAKSAITVVGNSSGQLQVLDAKNGLRKLQACIEQGARINALAVSPDGDECVYAYVRGDEYGLKRWAFAEAEPQAVVAGEKRQFQRIAYTTDGSQLVAGINSGIWIWDRSGRWFEQKSAKRIDSIRGDLLNIQSISPTQLFVTMRFQNNRVLLHVLDHTTGKAIQLKLPEGFETDLNIAAHTLVDGTVVMGTTDNRLFSGTLDLASAAINDVVELDEKHRSPVTEIVSDGAGSIITCSNSEPLAHVWKYADRKWIYDTNLTGTQKNLMDVSSLAVNKVLGVDENGEAILWNVERQKQRAKLERQAGGQIVKFNAPLRDVIAGGSDGTALAIDANGVVDRWNLVDGGSERIDAERWSYFGHTPGAELVDNAIDLERGVVITVARLRNADKRYLADASHDWEFCVWDAASGEMQRRWTAPNRKIAGMKSEETIDQRITLVDKGRKMLVASDRETRFIDLGTEREFLVKDDFGSSFGVPNPTRPSLVMLVKRSGAVRLFDLQQPESWENPAMQEYTLAGSSEMPLRGAWSTDGSRFYLAFSAGGLAAYELSGDRLRLTWSNRKLEDDPQSKTLRNALQVQNGRVQSHLDLDLIVEEVGGSDEVYVASRSRDLAGSTKLVRLRFAGADPTLVEQRVEKDVRWLQVSGGQVKLSDRLHDTLILDVQRIRSRQSLNGKVFVSTDSAQVLGLQEGKLNVMSYGRVGMIATTGTADGKTLFVLFEDGAIWKFQADADKPWQRLAFTALGAKQIKSSLDGKRLFVLAAEGARVVDPASGAELQALGDVVAANWDPSQSDRLAIARPDGSLLIWSGGQLAPLAQRADLSLGGIVDVQFFTESWNGKNAAPRRHLLIQTENAQNGQMQFLALDGPAEMDEVKRVSSAEAKPLQVGTRLKASPTEGIIASGAPNGTVTVWYATPSYEPYPRQLFDLEGHRGGRITCVSFSNDGKTIITADDEERLFAWLSSDPLAVK